MGFIARHKALWLLHRGGPQAKSVKSDALAAQHPQQRGMSFERAPSRASADVCLEALIPNMTIALYWFRDDLRLTDNPSLVRACQEADRLILLHVRDTDEVVSTRWGFPRWSVLRRGFRDQAVEGLATAVAERGGVLLRAEGSPVGVITELARSTGASRIYCQDIPAPYERADIAALTAGGLEVRVTSQSTLLDSRDLPFTRDRLPEVFTAFRQSVERTGVVPHLPLSAPMKFPEAPNCDSFAYLSCSSAAPILPASDASFPFGDPAFHGSESAALAHVARYFHSDAPATYKATRNGLMGTAYSTKFSPWLAVGAVSPRTIFAALKAHEAEFRVSDGSYWIWFELLWRDFFRFWSEKHGPILFRASGVSTLGPPAHDPDAFRRWRDGETGQPFVDAGMRELMATGYLSNRLRQVVASYLIHDLACDWRAGAAWFESRLIDYDVCSNHGNWLYIAGRGTDPRHGRRFDPVQQAAAYDQDGAYRALWATARKGEAL